MSNKDDQDDVRTLKSPCTGYQISEWMRDSVADLSDEEKAEMVSDASKGQLEVTESFLDLYKERRHDEGQSFDHGIHEFLAILAVLVASAPGGESDESTTGMAEQVITVLAMPDVLSRNLEIDLEGRAFRLLKKIEFLD